MMSVALKNDTDQSDTTIKNNYHRKLIVLIEEKILTVKNFNCTANRDGRNVHKSEILNIIISYHMPETQAHM